MAGGADGVRRVVSILEKDLRTTMQLLGVSSIAELEPGHVTLR
jgi:isopentenyl diphosphate isomerase/L-lactate dehydrogenase-like FMN-dependent dehydrogenase